MPATRVLAALAGILLALSAALFLVPPRALPDRLAVIAEDAVRIDNDFYSTHDWWHVVSAALPFLPLVCPCIVMHFGAGSASSTCQCCSNPLVRPAMEPQAVLSLR